MNKILITFSLAVFVSCNANRTESKNNYPATFTKVLDAHGGLEKWKSEKTLTFEIPKPDGKETHTIDLDQRKDKITSTDMEMGYDGKNVWLLDNKGSYQGDPYYFHNLMFYFYAMPFVLADDGIHYTEIPDFAFEGKNYPGLKITYDNETGASSNDVYHLYYDPETFKMRWLAYIATFGSEKKSDKMSWISYNDWTDVNGSLLPKSITWHAFDSGQIKEAGNTVTFENATLSEEEQPENFFEKPEAAKVVEKKED